MTITDPRGKATGSSGNNTGWKLGAVFMFVLAVLGAIPTIRDLYSAWVLDVDWSEVPFAVQQRRLWEKNYMCATQPGQEVANEQKLQVRVLTCPSGDVLVTVYQPGKSGRALWVPAEGFKSAALAIPGMGVAHAQERTPGKIVVAQGDFSIMCQEWVDKQSKRKIVRIIKLDGKCFREEINVLTGEIGPRVEVPCNTKCADKIK